jgi:hypothetical protein
MIFLTSEPTQYSGIAYNFETKDRLIYRNKNLTIKFPSLAAFFEKCACLLSAIYMQLE